MNFIINVKSIRLICSKMTISMCGLFKSFGYSKYFSHLIHKSKAAPKNICFILLYFVFIFHHIYLYLMLIRAPYISIENSH